MVGKDNLYEATVAAIHDATHEKVKWGLSTKTDKWGNEYLSKEQKEHLHPDHRRYRSPPLVVWMNEFNWGSKELFPQKSPVVVWRKGNPRHSKNLTAYHSACYLGDNLRDLFRKEDRPQFEKWISKMGFVEMQRDPLDLPTYTEEKYGPRGRHDARKHREAVIAEIWRGLTGCGEI